MNRSRRLVGFLSALAISSLIAVGNEPLVQAQEDEPRAENPALEDLAACVKRTNGLLVLFLVDESGSLRETDPANQRVTAINAALGVLDSLRRTTIDGTEPAVEVSLGGFSVGFEKLVDWTRLDNSSIETLRGRAAEFAARNTGLDTDYFAALHGAREQLATGADRYEQSTGKPPCKAILWFTDGQYDIEDRLTPASVEKGGRNKAYAPEIDLDRAGGGARLEERGVELLCSSNGEVDQIRTEETKILAIALAVQIEPADQEFLRAVSGAPGCGDHGTPLSGTYVPAQDLDQLVLGFSDLCVELEGCTPTPPTPPTPPCVGAAAPECTRTFLIDEGLRRFRLLVLTGADGIDVEIRAPGGPDPARFTPPSAKDETLGRVQLHGSWLSPDAVLIDAVLPTSGGTEWAGEWSISFIDPSGTNRDALARARLYLFGDLYPSLSGHPELVIGESNDLRARLVNEKGTPSTQLEDFQTVELSAQVIEPTTGDVLASFPLAIEADDTFRGGFVLPEGLEAQPLNVALRLSLVTKAGIGLAPVVRTESLSARAPVSFPSVTPSDVLTLPDLEGKHSSTAAVTITGGKTVGCVWAANAALPQHPGDAENIRVVLRPDASARANCIRVEPGETRRLEVQVTPGHQANGTATGSVEFTLRNDETGEVITQRVGLSVDLLKVADTTTLILVLFLLLALGLGLPLAAMYLISWRSARFEDPSDLRLAHLPVGLTENHLEFTELQEPPDVSHRDFHYPADDLSEREFSVHGVSFSTHISWDPTQPPYGTACARDRIVSAPDDRDVLSDTARVPLALPGAWVFVVDETQLDPARHNGDDDSAPVTGAVLAFIEQGDSRKRIPEVERHIRRNLPAVVRTLRGEFERWHAATGPVPPPDEDGVEPETQEYGNERAEPVAGEPSSTGEDDFWSNSGSEHESRGDAAPDKDDGYWD